MSLNCKYDSAISVFLSDDLKSQVWIWHKTAIMTVGRHNFVKFIDIKPNCQKHSGCVFASGKNAMYPSV